MNQAMLAGDKPTVLSHIVLPGDPHQRDYLMSLMSEGLSKLAQHTKNADAHDGAEFGNVAVAVKSEFSKLPPPANRKFLTAGEKITGSRIATKLFVKIRESALAAIGCGHSDLWILPKVTNRMELTLPE